MQASTVSGYAFTCTHGGGATRKAETQSTRRVCTNGRCKGDAIVFAIFLRGAAKHETIPVHDPRILESINYHE